MGFFESLIVLISVTGELSDADQSGLIRYQCDGKPCQNGGTCTSRTQIDDTQVRFQSSVQLITSELSILEKIHHTATKPNKIFECFCADGFTGTFCEFKTEQDHLLFVSTTVNDFENTFNDKLVFNADGRLIEEDASIGKNSGA